MVKKIDMNDPRVKGLEDAFASCDERQVEHFFSNMPEPDRLFLAPYVLAWVKKATYEWSQVAGTACLGPMVAYSVLATCSLEEIMKAKRKLSQAYIRWECDTIVRAFTQRKPVWIEQFVIWYMYYEPFDHSGDGNWWAYWELRQAGICPAIYDKAVLFRMAQSLYSNCESVYREHPELLQNEFWYFFEMEFPIPFWFTSMDMGAYTAYSHYLNMYLKFVKEGLIDRKRLLQASLGTLKFAYPEHEMRWYVQVHRQLKPNCTELKEHEQRYMELLGDTNACSLALGFDMLMELEKSKQLDDALFLDCVIPLFNERPKARSKTALQLVAKIAKRKPDLRYHSLHVALTGLRHLQVDVQTAAAAVLQNNLTASDHDVIEEIKSLLPLLADSPRRTLNQFLCSLDHAEPDMSASARSEPDKTRPVTLTVSDGGNINVDAKDEVPDRRHLQPLDVPRLDVLERLVPIATQDELIDTIIRVCTSPGYLDDYERIYDGINRLHSESCENFELKISPIRNGFNALEPRGLYQMIWPDYASVLGEETRAIPQALLLLIACWMTQMRAEPDTKILDVPFGGKRKRLLREPVKRCAYLPYAQARETCFRMSQGISLTPLSSATHHGGWIDPLVLVERIVGDPHGLTRHDHYDKLVSLYRLPIDHRAQALVKLGNILPDDSYVNTVRAILSCDDVLNKTLPDCYRKAHETDIALRNHKPLFSYKPECATGAKARETLERAQTNLPPPPGSISEVMLSPPDPEIEPGLYPLTFYHQSRLLPHWTYISYKDLPTLRASIEWRAQLVPAVRGPFYWYASEKLLVSIDDPYDGPGPDVFIEPLLDSNEPIDFPAALAVFAALTARGKSLATLAQDVLVRIMNDGRADSAILTQAAQSWIQGGISKMVRWANRLETVSLDSRMTTECVRQILIGIIPCMDVKILGAFLELLNELCVRLDRGVEDEECRKFLGGLKGSGKAAKLARAILDIILPIH
ncbi:MAG: DUF6493 family protein [Thermoguttaceae bacterium]|nr:DUF6493 family protein [Thermoguttaceae bacterium]